MHPKNLFAGFLSFILLLCLYGGLWSVGSGRAEKIKVVRDDSGFKLTVNGKDFFVKGVVWSYIPSGAGGEYSLWTNDRKLIVSVLDSDFSLMTNTGFNAIRVFNQVPPVWIEYLFDRFGVRTVVFDQTETYTVPVPDFGDPAVREKVLAKVGELAKVYRNTRGVLCYALGNEQNYKVTNRSNLSNLYTLYNECAKKIKASDSNHPVMIVNGDTKDIRMVRNLAPDVDIFGANVYRGVTGGSVFAEVKVSLDKPLLFTEFGCDAYNQLNRREDPYYQDKFLRNQWKEIYLNSGGKGKGNCIGGFIFQWRDEWWKSGNPAVHEEKADWGNPAYGFDYSAGFNINEEWWGICGLSQESNAGGFQRALPRFVFHTLFSILRMDPYRMNAQKIQEVFSNL